MAELLGPMSQSKRSISEIEGLSPLRMLPRVFGGLVCCGNCNKPITKQNPTQPPSSTISNSKLIYAYHVTLIFTVQLNTKLFVERDFYSLNFTFHFNVNELFSVSTKYHSTATKTLSIAMDTLSMSMKCFLFLFS